MTPTDAQRVQQIRERREQLLKQYAHGDAPLTAGHLICEDIPFLLDRVERLERKLDEYQLAIVKYNIKYGNESLTVFEEDPPRSEPE